MGTVAPPLTFLFLLLHLAEGSFPEEPSPLSFVPIEGTCIWICVCVCVRACTCGTDEWLCAGCGNQRSGVGAWVQRGFKAESAHRCIQNGFTLPLSENKKKNVSTKGRWKEESGDNWTGWRDVDDRREG